MAAFTDPPAFSTTAPHSKLLLWRRRFVAAYAASVDDGRKRRRSWKHRFLARLDWDAHVASFTETEFRLYYRIPYELFNEILGDIRPLLTTGDVRQAYRSSLGPVEPEVRLAVALRWLAGGQVVDIARLHRISIISVRKSLWTVVDAINAKFPFSFPTQDEEALKELERGFRSKSTFQCFEGCVGAVDGLIIKIRRPSYPAESSDPSSFWVGRKHCYGLNLQAVCDSKYRFTFGDIRFPGRSADSQAFRRTGLGQTCLDSKLPAGFFIVGDAAYTLTNSLLIPVAGTASQMGPWADSYNFHLSQLRITIEQSFGILIRRWGCMWRPLEVRHDRTAHVVLCCMKLHNLCIDHGDATFGISDLDAAECHDNRPIFDRRGIPVHHLTDDRQRPPPEGVDPTHTRNILIQHMKDMLVRRPS